MKKKRIVFVVSGIDKSLGFEWLIKQLDHNLFCCSFILLNDKKSQLEQYLVQCGIPSISIKSSGKRNFVKTLFLLIHFLKISAPDVIHCHLFEASLFGLLAGKLVGVKKRIYTRHHSTYNLLYNKKGVLLDRIINWLATDIVAISKNVQQVLIKKEKVNPEKVKLIYHGFDLEAFSNPDKKSIRILQEKYNPKCKRPVIGIIARWIEWKGIQYIIPAFQNLLNEYPNALLVLANARGPFFNEINTSLKSLPTKSYEIIEFENDLYSLYKLFDIYVHTPVDPEIEAFGQTYVEALAAKVPSVFTMSGIAKEFIVPDLSAIVVDYRNEKQILNGIKRILNDEDLKKELINNGLNSISKFELHNMMEALQTLYLE